MKEIVYLPTYGEAWFEMKAESNSMETKFDDASKSIKHLQRMGREDAAKYYNQKCITIFKNLGFEKKIIKIEFEVRLHILTAKVRKQTEAMLTREAKRINYEYLYGEAA